MSYDNIIAEVRGKVGLITLNRPKQLNALNDDLMNEMGSALADFEADENIGAIVITGSEKAFAAGADITVMQSLTYMEAVSYTHLDVYKRQAWSKARPRSAGSGLINRSPCAVRSICTRLACSRNSCGMRTAWLLPFMKTRVVTGAMADLCVC